MNVASLKLELRSKRWHEVKLHGTAVVAVALCLLFDGPRTALILGGVICFLVYFYLGMREARRAPLLLSPLSFYFFWYTVGLGICPFYTGLVSNPTDSVRFASDEIMVPLDDLAKGYLIFLVGSLAL